MRRGANDGKRLQRNRALRQLGLNRCLSIDFHKMARLPRPAHGPLRALCACMDQVFGLINQREEAQRKVSNPPGARSVMRRPIQAWRPRSKARIFAITSAPARALAGAEARGSDGRGGGRNLKWAVALERGGASSALSEAAAGHLLSS